MEYQNTKTGFILMTDCTISGENWVQLDQSTPVGQAVVPVTEKVEHATETPVSVDESNKEPEVSEDLAGFDGITIKEIKQELDAQGIEYDPKAKKQVLYDLMMNQGK
ncbi:hypothetical protein [Latilactobacillus fragifolii]|uniref:hypothetical protein n=1 Tax=Latilactobacillus fragifolii TaxID=2814244 RepID=UPI001ABB1024|nr:hypothetical protein [Latilactobacillus fragifolii]